MRPHEPTIETLYVLYDPNCSFCQHCKRWMEHQPKMVWIEFIAAGSPVAKGLFPELYANGSSPNPEELIVVDNLRGVYRDATAWLMCLWGLAGYRAWSYRLASPALLPLARRAFGFLSSHRYALSRLLYRDMQQDELLKQINDSPEPKCELPNGLPVTP